ncbi:hypothetical protein J6590_002353 [Homalodisca vitripennis]|nr:hypothetical protein J6590_002353 [Homalodisca vitripennis]
MYACEMCGKLYSHAVTLRQHVKHVCGKAPRHCCQLCDYKTPVRGTLLRHLRTVHKQDIPPERFTVNNSKYTTRHLCTCGKHYKNKASLVWHIRHECGKAPAHSCPHCVYKTRVRSSLLRHLRNVHKLDVPPERYISRPTEPAGIAFIKQCADKM